MISKIGTNNSECESIDKIQNYNGDVTSLLHSADDGFQGYFKAELSLNVQVSAIEASQLLKQMEENLFKNVLVSFNST